MDLRNTANWPTSQRLPALALQQSTPAKAICCFPYWHDISRLRSTAGEVYSYSPPEVVAVALDIQLRQFLLVYVHTRMTESAILSLRSIFRSKFLL